MHIQILHIAECPNWVEAGERLRAALVEVGRGGDEVTFRLLRSSAEAAEVAIAGSPTILLDGVDAFASVGRTGDSEFKIEAAWYPVAIWRRSAQTHPG